MMTRKYFLIILTAILLVSCSRTKTEYWPNGSKKSEIGMVGGKYEGRAAYWDENGNIQTVCTYRNNIIDGVLRSYHLNGKVQAEQHYSGGVLDGPVTGWDDEGNMTSEGHYRKGVLHGRYAEYYPNKSLKFEGNYIDGDLDGFWLYYDPSGMIVGEGTFKRGTGFKKTFYGKGTAKQVTHYTKNEKDGEEVFYRPDGTPDVTNFFVKGKLTRKIQK